MLIVCSYVLSSDMISFTDSKFSVCLVLILATVHCVYCGDYDLLEDDSKPRIFPGSFFPMPSMTGLFSGLGEAGRVAAVMARDASDAWQAVADRRMGEPAAGYDRYKRY